MDPYRLPRDVVPTRYDLRLEPDLPRATFRGEATIALTVREATSTVLLNAIELTIHEAVITRDGGESQVAAVALEEATERCRLTFPAPLTPGSWTLHLSFQGTLNSKLRGFYRSQYKDAAGNVHLLAATQFEATDARRAFPCWDEPAFKAVFATTLIIDPGLTAISNTAVVSETEVNGRKVVRFADSIPMSTYLVAFVVGELEATEPTAVGRVPLRVWCRPGNHHLARFGQEIGAFSLQLYEQYYGQPYPGDKLDLLAIPDFAAGAMENLGAITFRETALLVDEQAATHAELERVADVVAHENAHMWFGDLVTMAWWNGLWLNEAFATFLEMVAVDAWKPEWQRWTTFGVSRAAALAVDGLHSTRSIEYPVEAPHDADAMFDVLTYEKGASVLRMIEQHLGAEVFRAGVQEYLRRHAFGNTETSDLWQALGDVARQPIPAIMDGWIFRPGYPLLTARVEDGKRLVLTQQRFTYLPHPAESASVWRVPVQVRFTTGGAAQSVRLLLTDAETSLELPADWRAVVVNENGHGFYRVRYAPELVERLLAGGLDGLAAIERFNLVNDSWAATLAGLMPLTTYLDLTARFRGERDKNVWTVLVGSWQVLNRIIADADRGRMEALVRDRIGPAAADLGWSVRPGESELTRQLRGDLLRASGTLGNDPPIQARAAEVYAASLRDPTGVDANILAAAIAVLAHTGDTTRYEELLARYRSARTPQEEQRYLYALIGFRSPDLLEQTLARILNGEVRTQDAPYLLRTLLQTVHGRDLAWSFIEANWERINREFPVPGIRRLFEGIVGLASADYEQRVRAFFADRKVDLGGKTLQQYLEQLHVAVLLREREGKALHDYLVRGPA
jgi:puromycin-sensitive aminopeptidase